MTTRSWKIYFGIALFISAISLFLDWRFTCGYLLGVVESLFHYRRVETFWNQIVDVGVVSKRTGSGRFISHYALMILAFSICVIFPNVFNILGCALGMLMVKVATVVEELLHRGGLI